MSAFPTKSIETRVKKALPPVNPLQTDISIWPVGDKAYGVAIKLAGKPMQSKLIDSKSEIITFLTKVL